MNNDNKTAEKMSSENFNRLRAMGDKRFKENKKVVRNHFNTTKSDYELIKELMFLTGMNKTDALLDSVKVNLEIKRREHEEEIEYYMNYSGDPEDYEDYDD